MSEASKMNHLKSANTSRKKNELLNKDTDKILIDQIKRKDIGDKKSTEINSRNKLKVLDSYLESKTMNMNNNHVSFKNISFFKQDNKLSANFNSPYARLDTKKTTKNKLVTSLKNYQILVSKKGVNKTCLINDNQNSSKNNIKTSTSELKRILSPLKVNVDLNLISFNDDKNIVGLKKGLSIYSERTKLSRSFNTTEYKFNFYTRNKKNSLNLNFNSFDNEKLIAKPKYNSKDTYNGQIDSRVNIHKYNTNLISLQKKSLINPSIMNSSLNLAKQNFNFLNDNFIVESLENKKLTKDLSTKEITLQKNEVESIEDMHFILVKFLKQSKSMEKDTIDGIVRSSSTESDYDNIRINEGI
jgi:hypothetical protein